MTLSKEVSRMKAEHSIMASQDESSFPFVMSTRRVYVTWQKRDDGDFETWNLDFGRMRKCTWSLEGLCQCLLNRLVSDGHTLPQTGPGGSCSGVTSLCNRIGASWLLGIRLWWVRIHPGPKLDVQGGGGMHHFLNNRLALVAWKGRGWMAECWLDMTSVFFFLMGAGHGGGGMGSSGVFFLWYWCFCRCWCTLCRDCWGLGECCGWCNGLPMDRRRRQPRIFRNRPDFLNILTAREIKTKYRLNREQIEDLHHQIEDDIRPQTMWSHAVPSMIKVRFFYHLLFFLSLCIR